MMLVILMIDFMSLIEVGCVGRAATLRGMDARSCGLRCGNESRLMPQEGLLRDRRPEDSCCVRWMADPMPSPTRGLCGFSCQIWQVCIFDECL